MERSIFQAMSQRHVIGVAPTATVFDAACVMTRANTSSVLVIDGSNQLQGIVTERDLTRRVLAKALDPKATAASAVMTPDPHCVPPEMKVADGVLMMIERGFRHLPVVAANGKILGVFSVLDALPREVSAAVSLAEFHEQLNDALG